MLHSLHDSLMNKNSTTFWKMWKNKFGGKITSANLVEGHSDESLIANEFANFFGKPVETDAQQNCLFKQQFSDRLLSFDLDHSFAPGIEIELVDSLLYKMSEGKAAGIDKLTCKHIQNSHPIVISTITKLFNLMLLHNYVPNDLAVELSFQFQKIKKIGDRINLRITEALRLAQCSQNYLSNACCIF